MFGYEWVEQRRRWSEPIPHRASIKSLNLNTTAVLYHYLQYILKVQKEAETGEERRRPLEDQAVKGQVKQTLVC